MIMIPRTTQISTLFKLKIPTQPLNSIYYKAVKMNPYKRIIYRELLFKILYDNYLSEMTNLGR